MTGSTNSASTDPTGKQHIDSIPTQLTSNHSVLLPAPVPQVNPWSLRKSTAAALISGQQTISYTKSSPSPSSLDKSTPNPKPSTSANKENADLSSTSTNQQSKAKFSRTDKWVPYTDAEIELTTSNNKNANINNNKSKSKNKSKKKKAKAKVTAKYDSDGNPGADAHNHNNERSNDILEHSRHSGMKTKQHSTIPEATNELKNRPNKVVDKITGVSNRETKESDSTSEVGEHLAKLDVKDSSAAQQKDPFKTESSISDSEAEGNITGELRSSNQKKGKHSNGRNSFKHRNGYKLRSNSGYDDASFYGMNNGYVNYSGNKTDGYRSQYPPMNNFGFPGAPYFGQVPFINPMYANTAALGFATGNPMISGTLLSGAQYNNQFDPNYKFVQQNNNTGYSSDRSFNETESAGSSASPSRRTSSVGPQAQLPKFIPNQPQKMFFNNGMIPPGAMGQALFIPQYPQQVMLHTFQQQFAPTMPQQPSNYDPRLAVVIKQLTYYFSLDNLLKDLYLRKLMNPSTGGVKLSLLLKFHRLKILIIRESRDLSDEEEKEGLSILRTAVDAITDLELIENGDEVKLKQNWERWILSENAVESKGV